MRTKPLTRNVWPAVTAALGALAMALSVSCNPFATGDPEPPGGDGVVYPPPTSPDKVLEIIALAMEAEDAPAYLERLSESFVFTPDPVQMNTDDFANFPDQWTSAEEEAFLRVLFGRADTISVEWSDVLSEPSGPSQRVTARYSVRIVGSVQSAEPYTGEAEIVMLEDGGDLYIDTWDDLAAGSATRTWGLLRARLFTSQ